VVLTHPLSATKADSIGTLELGISMITAEQIESAKAGQKVELRIGGVDLVLLRRDLLELSTADYDDGEWTEEERRAVAARTFEQADNAGPIA
jgi:hypothetical protein